MAHARIIQQQMLDWIKNSLSLRSALPTDAQIVDRFNLTGVESARSLLADLADADEITIKGHGSSRTIALGRKAKTFEPAPRPTPAVVARVGGKRADDEKVQIDTTAARIREILDRRKAPASEVKPEVIESHTEARVEQTAADEPVSGERKPQDRLAAVEETLADIPPLLPADYVAAHQPDQLPPHRTLSRQEAAIATRDVRWQLNIHFPQDQFEKLSALADVAGETPGAFARGALISCIDRKPRVPAAVTAAALREKAPVIDFADRMMVLGLAAYAHERARSAA